MKRAIVIALASIVPLASSPGPVCAADPQVGPVAEYFRRKVLPWLNDPVIIDTIKAQNATTKDYSLAHIEALDREWRVATDGGDRALIDKVLRNDLSHYLHSKQALSNGIIGEVFVMDAKGLVVGESDITSDYWQGDEDKFQKSFGEGATGFFIDKVEEDESTQSLQSQASMTINDEHGRPIGAITVGVNIEAF